MTDERRKNYHEKLGGMSTGTILGMIALLLTIVGSIWTGSGIIHNLRADVNNNKESIGKERELSRQEKIDVTKQVQESEKRTREDIQALTRIVVEKLK